MTGIPRNPAIVETASDTSERPGPIIRRGCPPELRRARTRPRSAGGTVLLVSMSPSSDKFLLHACVSGLLKAGTKRPSRSLKCCMARSAIRQTLWRSMSSRQFPRCRKPEVQELGARRSSVQR
eukprot:6209789-Pleurochrysis_carterae.AAC.2